MANGKQRPRVAPSMGAVRSTQRTIRRPQVAKVRGFSHAPAAAGVVRIASGDVHNAALRGDGQVVCWGDNTDGQSTPPTGLAGVTDVMCGTFMTMTLHANRTLSAWGYAGSGQCTVPVCFGMS